MQLSLPPIFKQFRYSQIASDSTSAGDGNTTNRLYVSSIWNSKRLRVVVPLTILLLLVAGGVYYHDNITLPTLPDYSSLSPGAPATDSKDLVHTNPDILNSVAPSIDWSRFAYVQYVTNLPYLCNSVMLFEILDRLGCRPGRLMMYPQGWNPDTKEGENENTESRLLKKARDKYNVQLQPIHVQSRASSDPTWAESYTKLLAMNQTQYDRVLSLDSDSTVLQCLDELFLLPPAPVAMPRAYWRWKDHYELSSQLLLVETNATEFDRVMRTVEGSAMGQFDMDILNTMYLGSAMVLPHREYDLLTGEFNHCPKDHTNFLGNSEATWDAKKVLAEAKFLHFSDWPIPKPWIGASQGILDRNGPKCDGDNCVERDIWYGIYDDFKKRRKEVCDMSV